MLMASRAQRHAKTKQNKTKQKTKKKGGGGGGGGGERTHKQGAKSINTPRYVNLTRYNVCIITAAVKHVNHVPTR